MLTSQINDFFTESKQEKLSLWSDLVVVMVEVVAFVRGLLGAKDGIGISSFLDAEVVTEETSGSRFTWLSSFFAAPTSRVVLAPSESSPPELSSPLLEFPGLATSSIFFCFLFGKQSLICIEGKSMTPRQGGYDLFRSSNQFSVTPFS